MQISRICQVQFPVITRTHTRIHKVSFKSLLQHAGYVCACLGTYDVGEFNKQVHIVIPVCSQLSGSGRYNV